MNWSDIFLLCFAVGTVWSVASFLLGGLHLGHGFGGHAAHGAAAHAGAHGGHAGHGGHGPAGGPVGWLASMVNPSAVAVFLAWFGGIGYLLTRHTGLEFWLDLTIAAGFGLFGAWLLAGFLRFLQSREKPLDPSDYEMVGVLGRVSSTVRPDGVGELIYVKDGARRPVCARSEDGALIERGTEAVITRFEKGIAYLRTWDAMVTRPDLTGPIGEALEKKDKTDVQ